MLPISILLYITYYDFLISFLVTFVPHCVIGMLWSINGWSWSDAIPNLPTRGSALAAGIYFTLSVKLQLNCLFPIHLAMNILHAVCLFIAGDVYIVGCCRGQGVPEAKRG